MLKIQPKKDAANSPEFIEKERLSKDQLIILATLARSSAKKTMDAWIKVELARLTSEILEKDKSKLSRLFSKFRKGEPFPKEKITKEKALDIAAKTISEYPLNKRPWQTARVIELSNYYLQLVDSKESTVIKTFHVNKNDFNDLQSWAEQSSK